MFWNRRELKPIAPPEAEPEEKMIQFRADDDCYRRAQNIWRALGIVDSRDGMLPAVAYYLTLYRDWDFHRGAGTLGPMPEDAAAEATSNEPQGPEGSGSPP